MGEGDGQHARGRSGCGEKLSVWQAEMNPEPADETRNAEMRARGPLVGCRVLELGSTIAGPFCARLLADFGAEVIKIEALEGDQVRSMGNRYQGKSLYAASLLRNKSLAAIDLRHPEGQAIVRNLVQHCDVVVENFRPGTLEKWGLAYEDLARINPRIVLARVSGFGQTGPYSQRAGYGVVAEAVSGLRNLMGDPDRPPARVAVALTDYITGLYAAFGVVMALYARHFSGRGQVVDAALSECAFSFLEPHVPSFEKLGIEAKRAGSGLANSAPNNLYPTQDGQYIQITAIADPVFRRFAQIIGREDVVNDERFATAFARGRHIQEMDAIVTAWTRTLTAADAEGKLNAAAVPAARIYTLSDIFGDPHFQIRGMLSVVPDADFGTVTLASPVPKLSATPGRVFASGGAIGRDTKRILHDLAGLDMAEIDRLERAGVISTRPAAPTKPKAAAAE
jgi:crotonobetainyl-CoA:carnitine CoA-transferase CaiB-like acyl-CoA transferase